MLVEQLPSVQVTQPTVDRAPGHLHNFLAATSGDSSIELPNAAICI